MFHDRLDEEKSKLQELLSFAHLLDDKDRRLIDEMGVEAYKKIFDVKSENIFVPDSDYEIQNAGANIVRILRDPVYIYLASKYIFNIELAPFQVAILRELERRKYPMLIGSRGLSKSFLLALYGLWLCLFKQGSKIIITGAGFRQAKVVFNYMNAIWRGAPIFRDIVGGGRAAGPKFNVDECRFHVGESVAVAIPIGDGQKIRGARASCLINDEFGSLNEQIYEQSIAPFGATSASPIQKMKNEAQKDLLRRLHLVNEGELEDDGFGNQSILSGTADYAFKHFAKYWKQYRDIIKSKGDVKKLQEIFPEGVHPKFNHRSYSIIRIPFELIPKGIMDEEHIARSAATSSSGLHICEYGACFIKDSNGFFKRSLIEGCVCDDNSSITLPSCGRVTFDAVISGHYKRKYVMAIDPASQVDNFSIVILECWPDHRRVVYCWTINKKKHANLLKKGLINNKEFYSYCGRKIRNLMKVFPTERIIMDSQGGGYAIEEVLHDEKELLEGELPIWQIIEEDDEKDSDDYSGLHILEMVNFADANWTFNANHFLKKDMTDKTLLFPRCDPVTIANAIQRDKFAGRLSNEEDAVVAETLEDIIYEIEELKDELTTIEHSVTANGRDRWDTPEIQITSSATRKKGRLRKDRYSSLLMANMASRTIERTPIEPDIQQTGLSLAEVKGRQSSPMQDDSGDMFFGPAWYQDDIGGASLSDFRN